MSSSADTEDDVAVSDDGVTVRKRYAPQEFPVPAIRFEIESDRDAPVTVRLIESIPESFPMDAVGFHPEYHSDQWTAFQDNRVQFTGTLEPDESLVTVYGIRLDDEFDSSAFLTEPSIAVEGTDTASESTSSDVSESVDTVVSTDGNEAVKDMLIGDRESVPGLDSPKPDSESVTTETSEGSEPEIELDIDAAAERVAGEETQEGGQSSGTESEPEQDSEPAGTGLDESESSEDDDGPFGATPEEDATDSSHASDLISELAAALRSGAVADEDLRTLRDTIGSSQSGSTQAKLSHLQERVEDVAAYAGALEEFLDEEGTGAQFVDDVRTDLETLRSEVSTVSEAVETNTAAIDELDASVSDNSDTLDSVTSSLSSLESEFTSVDDSVAALESSVAGQSDALDNVSDQVSALDSTVDDLEDRTSAVESTAERNAEEVESMSETVDTIADDLESVSADVVEIMEWRDQLGSMFTDD